MGRLARRPFAARGRGSGRGVEVRLSEPDRAALVVLLDDVADLLDPGGAAQPEPDDLEALLGSLPQGPVDRPEDPAVARLLPDASRDDPELAGEFRRLTEGGLRARKCAHLRESAALLRGGAEALLLTPDQAKALLQAMTDVRLVLAERLGLRSDEDAVALHDALTQQQDPDDPWLVHAAVYDVLTWWQELLVEATFAARPPAVRPS